MPEQAVVSNDYIKEIEGRKLKYSVWKPAGATKAVVISPAMGVERRFYRHMGDYLANHGFAVYSFDYDGMYADQQPPRVSIAEWARVELATIIDMAATEAEQVFVVGHSIGGQILPLTPNVQKVEAAFMVAVQNVSSTTWKGVYRVLIELFWRVIVPVNLLLFKELKGWSYGGKKSLHYNIAAEWRRLGLAPQGIASVFPGAKAAFSNLNLPVKFNSLYDDHLFAPPSSVESLTKIYGTGKRLHDFLSKEICEGKPVGHFDFFRPSGSFLWPRMLDWFATYDQ